MACDFLSRSGPPELILHIFASCDSVRDVLALATACRHTHEVWRADAATVLWPHLLRETPEFEDGLIAARLTSLVLEAETRDELPPMAVSPGQFNSRRRNPTLPELEAAAALCRLVRALAIAVSWLDVELPFDRNGPRDWPEDNPDPQRGPEDPARMPVWEARVRKTFLRLLICGAALAGVYNEPLFQARASGDPELENLVGSSKRCLSDSQLSFLERFAVCNMQATPEAEEAVFGPLGDWLLDSILSDSESRAAMAERFDHGYGRASHCQRRQDSPCPVKLTADNRSHSDAHLVVWEITKMIWAYEHLGDLVHQRGYGYSKSGETFKEVDNGALQKAVVVFLGVFRAEKATLIERNSRWQSEVILADLAIPHDNDVVEYVFDHCPNGRSWAAGVSPFLHWIHANSGRPNVIAEIGDPVAPLRLKFFEYFLRRYTELRFVDDAFHPDEYGFLYNEFVRTLAIFAFDDVDGRELDESGVGEIIYAEFLDGSELLISFKPVPARLYKQFPDGYI